MLFLLQNKNDIMKTTVKLLSIAILFFLNIGVASAQKVDDFYKFDDGGNLCEFQQTLPDSTVVKYKHKYDAKGDRDNPFIDGEYATIIYPDGTVIDFSKSYFNGEFYPDKFPAVGTVAESPSHPGYYFMTINEWYKDLRKAASAPKGKGMIVNCFNLKEYSIIFPDNSQVEVSCSKNPDDTKIEAYIDVDENGDSLRGERWSLKSVSRHAQGLEVIDLGTGDSEDKECVLSLANAGYRENVDYRVARQSLEGCVYINNGETFKGKVYLYYLQGDSYKQYAPKSKYLKSIFVREKFPNLGFDNIAALSFIEGNVIDKSNKLVAMYKDNVKLDEFDMASLAAAEQGKIDKARAEAQKAASERKALTSKYGKKYADAFYEGKVIVGMPWELVQLGIDAHSFKDFYTALISIDRSSGFGKTQCYSLYGDDFTHRGHMWISNNAVESITLY